MKTTRWGLLIAVTLALGPTAVSAAEAAARAPEKVSYAGQVVNEQYLPIAGARVTLIGTPLSCSTDASGAFALQGVLPADARAGRALGPLEKDCFLLPPLRLS